MGGLRPKTFGMILIGELVGEPVMEPRPKYVPKSVYNVPDTLRRKIHESRNRIVAECKGQRVRKRAQVGGELSGKRPSASNFARLYKTAAFYCAEAIGERELERRKLMADRARLKCRRDATVFDNIVYRPFGRGC